MTQPPSRWTRPNTRNITDDVTGHLAPSGLKQYALVQAPRLENPIRPRSTSYTHAQPRMRLVWVRPRLPDFFRRPIPTTNETADNTFARFAHHNDPTHSTYAVCTTITLSDRLSRPTTNFHPHEPSRSRPCESSASPFRTSASARTSDEVMDDICTLLEVPGSTPAGAPPRTRSSGIHRPQDHSLPPRSTLRKIYVSPGILSPSSLISAVVDGAVRCHCSQVLRCKTEERRDRTVEAKPDRWNMVGIQPVLFLRYENSPSWQHVLFLFSQPAPPPSPRDPSQHRRLLAPETLAGLPLLARTHPCMKRCVFVLGQTLSLGGSIKRKLENVVDVRTGVVRRASFKQQNRTAIPMSLSPLPTRTGRVRARAQRYCGPRLETVEHRARHWSN